MDNPQQPPPFLGRLLNCVRRSRVCALCRAVLDISYTLCGLIAMFSAYFTLLFLYTCRCINLPMQGFSMLLETSSFVARIIAFFLQNIHTFILHLFRTRREEDDTHFEEQPFEETASRSPSTSSRYVCTTQPTAGETALRLSQASLPGPSWRSSNEAATGSSSSTSEQPMDTDGRHPSENGGGAVSSKSGVSATKSESDQHAAELREKEVESSEE